MTRAERLTKLIARMPKDVREEVAKLDAQVEKLQEKLRQNHAESYSSPVGIMEFDPKGGKGPCSVHLPLPVNRPIRFYPKHFTPKQRDGTSCYAEFVHDRTQETNDKQLIIEVRTGMGQLSIVPSSANGFYIIPKAY